VVEVDVLVLVLVLVEELFDEQAVAPVIIRPIASVINIIPRNFAFIFIFIITGPF